MSFPDPILVGIVGCGDIAADGHVHHYRTNPRFKLVAVADVDPAKARQFADDHGDSCRSYGSLDEMVSKERGEHDGIDAISICVGDAAHHIVAVPALREHKLHILLEKPPGDTLAHAREIVDAARLSGTVLLVGFKYRHMCNTILHKCTPETLGAVYHMEGTWIRRRGIPSWRPDTPAFRDLAPHLIDLALFLYPGGYPQPLMISGRAFSRLRQHSDRRPDQADLIPIDPTQQSEDTGLAVIDFRDFRLEINTAFLANTARTEAIELRIRGDLAGVDYPLVAGTRRPEDHAPRLYTENADVLETTTLGPPYPRGVHEGYAEQIRHFAACIDGEESPTTTFEEMLFLQTMLDGFYLSAQHRGRQVDLTTLDLLEPLRFGAEDMQP